MRVLVDGHDFDMVIADDGGDIMDMEFRTTPEALQPLVVVAEYGEPGTGDLRVSTFDDVVLVQLLALVRFGSDQHVVPAGGGPDPRAFTAMASRDTERSPGIEFRDEQDTLLLSAWVVASSTGRTTWCRVWEEIGLSTFDAMVARIDVELLG